MVAHACMLNVFVFSIFLGERQESLKNNILSRGVGEGVWWCLIWPHHALRGGDEGAGLFAGNALWWRARFINHSEMCSVQKWVPVPFDIWVTVFQPDFQARFPSHAHHQWQSHMHTGHEHTAMKTSNNNLSQKQRANKQKRRLNNMTNMFCTVKHLESNNYVTKLIIQSKHWS